MYLGRTELLPEKASVHGRSYPLELECGQAQGWPHGAAHTMMRAISRVSQACFLRLRVRYRPPKGGMDQWSESGQACTQAPDQPQNGLGARVQGSLRLEVRCCDCARTENDA